MARRLSATFKSLKPHSNSVPNPAKSLQGPSQISLPTPSSKDPSSSESPSVSRSSSRSSWVVYLILSTNPPIKTYVGVTSNFARRLKQHNGELKGGAKASRAGRPWICACLIKGFRNKSKACEFESKWKSCSRKLSRKGTCKDQEKANSLQLSLLQHRYTALNQVKGWIDCDHLDVNWSLDPL